MYEIIWLPKARKGLRKIDHQYHDSITEAVNTLKDLSNAKNVKALTKHQYGYRLEVGNYRVLFDANSKIEVIEVQEVKKRDNRTY